MQTPHPGQGRDDAEQNRASLHRSCTATAAALQPSDPIFWLTDGRWRKRLPWSRAIIAGPAGHCEYLCSRDQHMLAYRDPAGRWRPGTGEDLTGCAVFPSTWEQVWPVPSQCACWPERGRCIGNRIRRDLPGGPRFAPCDAPLAEVLRRCARHPATAWILTGEGAR